MKTFLVGDRILTGTFFNARITMEEANYALLWGYTAEFLNCVVKGGVCASTTFGASLKGHTRTGNKSAPPIDVPPKLEPKLPNSSPPKLARRPYKT
ncbi:hypothetical protein Zmor_004741 [Zophobas morio]|uniref:Uncharacterized protein n=1 Tax=Zophobas morio TaxID=2755281 RepID=A0AA38IRZ4_9CUCU|nr:hypothetical protein Zmor_004741 [Zophobas morio]